MGLTTDIQWADSTLNLQMGCDGWELWNPRAGVRICYAGQLTQRHAGKKGWPDAFERPRLFPQRLDEAERWRDLTGTDRPDKPWLRGLPRCVFLDDMGDTFTESLPVDWLAPHLGRLAAWPHVNILLTKRPGRMARFFRDHPPPTNFWLCTSVTNRTSLARVPHLLAIEGAAVLGLSVEPLWEGLDFSRVTGVERLAWVKVGGQSGP